jgi:hypothetical protein
MIHYRVANLDQMLEQLRGAGVPVDDRVEVSQYGRFGWVTDPEGNRFELWEPAPGLRGGFRSGGNEVLYFGVASLLGGDLQNASA